MSATYDSLTGGHAPGDLRGTFLAALEAYAEHREGPLPGVLPHGQQVTMRRICGVLWNCTDTLPRYHVGLAQGCDAHVLTTYATAARWLAGRLDGEQAA